MTWSRDSHGLYDYESRNVHKKNIQAVNSVWIMRTGVDIQLVSEFTDLSRMSGYAPLCHILQEKNEFVLAPFENEPLWLVVRSMKSQYGLGCILNEGDIIKLGRVSFKITSLKALEENESNPNTQELETTELNIPNEREQGACKICLLDESCTTNPLISPCNCSGSMKYIHLICLQTWLSSRMVIRNTENCVTYSWKSMECEICQSSYPFSFYSKGKNSDLFKVQRPDAPFLVLEAVASDRNNNKGIYIISINNRNSVKLGRGHDSDVRISDISVSRFHAVIKLKDGNFILEDNNSKFGTLINSNQKIHLSGYNFVVQAGRTVISMSAKSQSVPFERDLDMSIDGEIDTQLGKRSL